MRVTATEWGVSYTTPCSRYALERDPRTELNVYMIVDEPNQWGGRGVVVHHPEHNGLKFESVEEASDYAFAVGLLKEYVRA